uniref:Phage tail protein n=1 Tax=Caenorhabditis tropicalis TaxID=1561998 RepID=A0A1I7TU64_9PELO
MYYANEGTITMKSQNVEIPDLAIELDEKPLTKPIRAVTWNSKIYSYEIGEDVDEFEVDAREGGDFSSSSVMTASIKKIG